MKPFFAGDEEMDDRTSQREREQVKHANALSASSRSRKFSRFTTTSVNQTHELEVGFDLCHYY